MCSASARRDAFLAGRHVAAHQGRGEGRARRAPAPFSRLDDVPLALPALTRAVKLQKRAAEVGFDWPRLAPVLAKAEEEIAELKAAIAESEGGAEPDAACRRGVRRSAVRHGEYRAASRRRSGGRASRRQRQIRAAVSQYRGGARQGRPQARRRDARGDGSRCGTRRRRPRTEANSIPPRASGARGRRGGRAARASRAPHGCATQ